jgi:acetyl-CoA C-acetyltransferase
MAGRAAGHFSEIVPVVDGKGNVYAVDDGVRADASMAGMAKLKPFFDKKYGNITAANSSQITDGAAWVLLASEEAVRKWNLKPLGRIVDSEWAGLDPAQMGLGPVHASTPILQRNGLTLADVDYWELNEAFAAQVLGCQAAWKDDAYCSEQLDLSGAFGAIDEERLNVDGGAVSIGHPVGASGARIVLHLLHVLRRNNAKRGVATICIGGGLGGAMLIEAEG